MGGLVWWFKVYIYIYVCGPGDSQGVRHHGRALNAPVGVVEAFQQRQLVLQHVVAHQEGHAVWEMI